MELVKDIPSEADAIILAVPHADYLHDGGAQVWGALRSGGVLIDVKARVDRSRMPAEVRYWEL